MALRQCVRRVLQVGREQLTQRELLATRTLSSSTSDVIIDMDKTKVLQGYMALLDLLVLLGETEGVDNNQHGVATLKLNKGPVNSLNLEFLRDIINTVDLLEKEKGVRGLIITSALPGLFCAGLDVTEMYKPDYERLRQFWHHVQELWLRVYGSNLLVMSAINGHSPAGGCLLSVTPDYRVMAEGKYRIGLNETLLGMIAPEWFQKTMINTVGHRETERALQLGHLYPAQEALKVGLVDKLVPETEVMEATWAEMDKWLKIPDLARRKTKLTMRGPTIQWMLERRQDDADFFFDLLTHERTQRNMGMYIEGMKKKAAQN